MFDREVTFDEVATYLTQEHEDHDNKVDIHDASK